MPRGSRTTRPANRPTAASTKYDAHHRVLNTTYGSFADLRRELADSREKVAEREAVLKLLGSCGDPQRAYLLFDDYLEKLSLRRGDFGATDWWSRIQGAQGKGRLEEVAMLFLRANRSLPTELLPFANFERFQEVEQSEKEMQFVQELENWLLPASATTPTTGSWSSSSCCSVHARERRSGSCPTSASCAPGRPMRPSSSRRTTGPSSTGCTTTGPTGPRKERCWSSRGRTC
jgi:hypothetical protein